jgi:hypothetical protein
VFEGVGVALGGTGVGGGVHGGGPNLTTEAQRHREKRWLVLVAKTVTRSGRL